LEDFGERRFAYGRAAGNPILRSFDTLRAPQNSVQKSEASIQRLMAIVEYDGTDYHGFQMQAQGRTIQGEIEKALAAVTREKTRIVGAGRTDAGVHAQGQVVVFSTAWRHPIEELQRALNAVLPVDIAVRGLRSVAEAFHPRFDAVSREYRYTIFNRPLRSPLVRRFAYHFPRPLDVAALEEAASVLEGSHDFASFGRAPQGDNTVREVYRAQWAPEEPFVYFDIVATAFLYRMVRSLVGTLLLVGTRELSPKGFEEILQSADRSKAGQVAPAHGLCLMRVNY
jgi:tRNA pseudouridine38-40 synthase